MMNIFQRLTSYPLLGTIESASSAAGQPSEDDDHVLVLSAQQGDLKAFDQLVTRHRGKIYAMIRQMVKNEADAWDISQDVFIKAWQALPRFEIKARFSTWLYRIAHNAVYDWSRKKRPETMGELNDEIFNAEREGAANPNASNSERSPDEILSNDELRQKIEAALGKLSPEHREAVLLKDVQGLSYKEIAEVMHSSLGTVMSRLFYARQKLQSLLQDEYEAR